MKENIEFKNEKSLEWDKVQEALVDFLSDNGYLPSVHIHNSTVILPDPGKKDSCLSFNSHKILPRGRFLRSVWKALGWAIEIETVNGIPYDRFFMSHNVFRSKEKGKNERKKYGRTKP